jgi:hypothetical protein
MHELVPPLAHHALLLAIPSVVPVVVLIGCGLLLVIRDRRRTARGRQ